MVMTCLAYAGLRWFTGLFSFKLACLLGMLSVWLTLWWSFVFFAVKLRLFHNWIFMLFIWLTSLSSYQCAGCHKYHKLVDNLGLVVEYDFREEISLEPNTDQIWCMAKNSSLRWFVWFQFWKFNHNIHSFNKNLKIPSPVLLIPISVNLQIDFVLYKHLRFILYSARNYSL